MTATDIQKLISHFDMEPELTETHISYILLSGDFAYKIKKTIRLPFLDFSSLEARKFYCGEELRLNKRLAEDIYLAVVPVRQHHEQLTLGDNGKIMDYAVKMKRMDTSLEMDKMLARQGVREKHIDRLARKIADFHASAPQIVQAPSLPSMVAAFNEIDEQLDFIREYPGQAYARIITDTIHLSDRFLKSRQEVIQQRGQRGLMRDVHGDLHSKNIFLYDDPVIFDCIEFNPAFRQIDLLNEVAFFCMDLEARNAPDLSHRFYVHYLKLIKQHGLSQLEDEALFTYYKLYRANVRAKVMAISAWEDVQAKDFDDQVQELISYLKLMKTYAQQLEKAHN